MRKVVIYLLGLAVAAAAVFVLAYGFGRRASLEQELARRTTAGLAEDRSLTIESLRPPEEETGSDDEEAAPPETHQLGNGVTIRRYPQEEAGMALLVDGEMLSPGGGGYASLGRFRPGLEEFLSRLPAGVRAGLRLLGSGVPGDCGATFQLRPGDARDGRALREVLATAPQGGPRSIARALRDGAADLAEGAGERAMVVITGGDEECGGIPCQMAADLGFFAGAVKVYVVILLPPPFEDPYAAPPPVWQARMQCVADKGGGELFEVSSPGELRDALARIAASLRPNLTVRAFHAADREIEGTSLERPQNWGVRVSRSGDPSGAVVSNSFPAVFSVPAGTFDLQAWYYGKQLEAGRLGLTDAEMVDVQVNFRSGELYLQVKDGAGEEMVGDTTDFNCFWGAEVFEGSDRDSDHGSSCAFPAYFVLRPGTYTVRLWNGPRDHWLEEVVVREQETTVETVTFKEE